MMGFGLLMMGLSALGLVGVCLAAFMERLDRVGVKVAISKGGDEKGSLVDCPGMDGSFGVARVSLGRLARPVGAYGQCD